MSDRELLELAAIEETTMPKELEHQTSRTQYQIRINGVGVRFYNDMHKNMMTEFAAIARDNPDDYVDIVSVRTEILVNQYSYHQLKRHFDAAAEMGRLCHE